MGYQRIVERDGELMAAYKAARGGPKLILKSQWDLEQQISINQREGVATNELDKGLAAIQAVIEDRAKRGGPSPMSN